MLLIRLLATVLLVGSCVVQTSARGGDPPRVEIPEEWLSSNATAGHREMVGRPAPPLYAQAFTNGNPLERDGLRGKMVVVKIWATWCGPCLASIPNDNAVSEKYAEQGVVFVGICSSSRGQERLPQVIREREIRGSATQVMKHCSGG